MNEDESINILPLNDDPLSNESTTNPLFGETDAVTLPLAILNTSRDNADNGISNNPAPLPVNIDAVTFPSILVSPINLISAGISILSTTSIVPAIDECNWQL